jgi:predicted nucleic acid-binding protein
MLVVDASAVVKIYAPEEGSQAALDLLSTDPDRMIPAHAIAEIGEVLMRKVRLGELTALQIDAILGAVRLGFASVPLDDLIHPAVEISLRTGASIYDCLYVALATAENCRLVTADRRLIAKMAGTRFAPLITPLDSLNAPQ